MADLQALKTEKNSANILPKFILEKGSFFKGLRKSGFIGGMLFAHVLQVVVFEWLAGSRFFANTPGNS